MSSVRFGDGKTICFLSSCPLSIRGTELPKRWWGRAWHFLCAPSVSSETALGSYSTFERNIYVILPSKRRKQCSGSVFPMLIFSGTDDQDASADIPAVHHLRVNVMCVRCARRLNQTFGLSCSNSLISNLAQIATIFASCFMVASSRLRSPSAVQGLPGGSRARALWGHMH